MFHTNSGAVASECKHVSRTAIRILENGGNAIDASIAAAAVQGVTRPFSGGIGGDGFMHIYLARENRFLVIDHRAVAPKLFNERSFHNAETNRPFHRSMRVSSGMATAVPGVVKAWEEAINNYGKMTLAQVLEPAIEIAQKGFIVDANLQREIKENEARFKLFFSTKQIYFDKNGQPLQEGDIIKNPDFAKTYKLIAKYGSKVFYSGEIAHAIVKTVNNPPIIKKPNYKSVNESWNPNYEVIKGKMTLEDLMNYSTVKRHPISFKYRDYDIYAPPPVSSGGITIGSILNILEHYPLEKMSHAQILHYFIEACKYAYADRSKYIGDPSYFAVPVKGLLNKCYAALRSKQIRGEKASGVIAEPGNPYKYNNNSRKQISNNDLPNLTTNNSSNGENPDGCTIHLTVSDKETNIVSYTSTIVSIGGNGMVVPGYGFLLNNALTGLTSEVSGPNYPKSKIRPLSSMAPTIVFKDNQPKLALGSPGSATIITTIAQVLINYIDLNMSLPEAITFPRLTQQNSHNLRSSYEEIYKNDYKDVHGNNLFKELKQKKHKFLADKKVQGIGCVTGIEFLDNGRVLAVTEKERRGGGVALVENRKKDAPLTWHEKS